MRDLTNNQDSNLVFVERLEASLGLNYYCSVIEQQHPLLLLKLLHLFGNALNKY